MAPRVEFGKASIAQDIEYLRADGVPEEIITLLVYLFDKFVYNVDLVLSRIGIKLSPEQKQAMLDLDRKYDIPAIEFMLNSSYKAFRRLVANDASVIPSVGFTHEYAMTAAALGDMPVLAYLHAHGHKFDSFEMEQAIMGGHLDAIKYMREQGCPWDPLVFTTAAEYGNIEMLKWLHENGCPRNWQAYSGPAESGNLKVLQWLYENGCPPTKYAMGYAAGSGQITIAQWLLAHGFGWTDSTCTSAAAGGHLEMLQWLRSMGCSMDEFTVMHAAANGHLGVLQWLLDNGCPMNEHYAGWYARKNGHAAVAEYIGKATEASTACK